MFNLYIYFLYLQIIFLYIIVSNINQSIFLTMKESFVLKILLPYQVTSQFFPVLKHKHLHLFRKHKTLFVRLTEYMLNRNPFVMIRSII